MIARHDLVSVHPADWRIVLSDNEMLADLSVDRFALVQRWAAMDWPLVVRSRSCGMAATAIAVGMPFPPALGKMRIGLVLSERVRWSRRQAIVLDQARVSAPRVWDETLSRLMDLAVSLDVRPQVFGSLLWETVTGLSYVTPTSDLDLLWTIDEEWRLDTLLKGLGVIDAAASPRLDGEIVMPAGTVQWRELAEARNTGASTLVLAKSLGGADLQPVGSLLSGQTSSC